MNLGIDKSTLKFLGDLKKNNNREWFQENKSRFEAARQDYITFLEALLPEVAAFEPVATDQRGKDLLFRIYRDVRFSANKSPYKDHFGAYLAEGGRKSIYPGYYLHLSANNQSFMAAGVWMPPPAQLKALRQEIDYNLDQFEAIIKAPAFVGYFGEITGDKLKTTPKGYDSDNPALAYLRHKSWNAIHHFTDQEVTSGSFLKECVQAFRLAKPFNDFLVHPMREVSAPVTE